MRGWTRTAAGLALGVVVGVVPAGPGPSAGADSGDDVVEACAPLEAVPEAGPRACRSLEAGTWLAAQACRRVEDLEEALCPTIDGRPVHEAAMAEFEASWLAEALALQRQLDLDVPLTQALLPHTHNSANSAAYPPTLSTLDANQVLTLTDQLRLGIRAIEIDVHWTPHPSGDPAQGSRAVVQCHGEPVATAAGTVHAGCSVDTLLVDLLREVQAWLEEPANANEVLLVYLENALDDDPAAHAAAAAAIQATLGDLVARPEPGDGCQALPVARSKGQLLAAGTRVLITGNCGPGGWTDWVFDRYPSWDESGGSTFNCTAERAKVAFDSVLVRRYEDSTWLSAMVGSGSHLDAATMTDLVRCGVNLVGFDQLHPGDDRLPSLVWSWRADEPTPGATDSCAALGDDGRFFADACAVPRPVACRTATGGWAVTHDAVAWPQLEVACVAAGHPGAGVPANGWDSGALRAAADLAGAGEVWLAYRQDEAGQWITGSPATEPEPATLSLGHAGDRPAEPRGHGGPPSGPRGPGRDQPIAATRPMPAGVPALLAVMLAAVTLPAVAHRRRRLRR